MVVKLLIASCHCSEKPKKGPLPPHATRTASATMNAHGVPARTSMRSASRRKISFMVALAAKGTSTIMSAICGPTTSAQGRAVAGKDVSLATQKPKDRSNDGAAARIAIVAVDERILVQAQGAADPGVS